MIIPQPPDAATLQAWIAAFGTVATGLATIYIIVMQRINAAALMGRDKKLEVKTDAQSAKLDEIHTQTVNGSSKLAAVPGDPKTVPPIPRG